MHGVALHTLGKTPFLCQGISQPGLGSCRSIAYISPPPPSRNHLSYPQLGFPPPSLSQPPPPRFSPLNYTDRSFPPPNLHLWRVSLPHRFVIPCSLWVFCCSSSDIPPFPPSILLAVCVAQHRRRPIGIGKCSTLLCSLSLSLGTMGNVHNQCYVWGGTICGRASGNLTWSKKSSHFCIVSFCLYALCAVCVLDLPTTPWTLGSVNEGRVSSFSIVVARHPPHGHGARTRVCVCVCVADGITSPQKGWGWTPFWGGAAAAAKGGERAGFAHAVH